MAAYWVRVIVIGIADLAFLFLQVTPGIIEVNAGTIGGPHADVKTDLANLLFQYPKEARLRPRDAQKSR